MGTLTVLNNNSDTLCPNEPQWKEMEREFLLKGRVYCPLSAQSRFRRKENFSPSATSKRLFSESCLFVGAEEI
jgi:hypothetical protein